MTGPDVLLLVGEPHGPEVARMLICEVPAGRDLTWEQNRGQACVWCRGSGEHARLSPLGGAHGWRPYGCASCTKARVKFLHAYVAWRAHVQGCEPCQGAWCPDGWSLALDHNEAYEIADKKPVLHCACGCAFTLGSLRFRPYTEHTIGGPRYSHTGPCLRPGAPAAGDERLTDEVG
jgi:hypothetical protein